ncbi:MAG TPA: NUDIX domain-containing protein [Ilumatobacteraceae bacterium]
MDMRASIRSAVATRAPVDDREAASLTAFLEHFDALPAPFDEHADPVHVTGSAIVVGNRGVILHLHKRLGIWIQPGGHIDPGEMPWDAAVRETLEETGLIAAHPHGEPQLIHVDVHSGGRGHTHLDLRYLVTAPDLDPTPPPGESQDVQWFDWDTAVERADPGLAGALRSIRATL